jgi:DNA invertase Pin-like site-specific DNA recombinase
VILAEPLRAKHDDGVLWAILPARISKPTQDPRSLDSQHFDTERWLASAYPGPKKVHRFGEQGSGWLVDRPLMVEAEVMIRTGEWDLVIVGEVREAHRNPRFQWAFVQDCVDHDTRFISLAEGIDTADEEWESRMHVATLLAGMAVPEVRRRVKRMATYAFHQGGMVLKIRFGYVKLTPEQADSGKFGPRGLRIAKVGEATPFLHCMRVRVLAGESYPVIADWLNDEGILPGPYVTGGKWTGALVRDLLRDPILSGQRRFRKEISRLVYGKGKNKPRANPKPPEMREFPELAHFTPDEHRELLDAMDRRKAEAAESQAAGRDSPLYNVPRARSLWPGQHARCSACGGLMYRYGEKLKCQNALGKGPRTCWNHVLVPIADVYTRVTPLVVQYLDGHGPLRDMAAGVAWAEYQRLRGRRNRSAAAGADRIAELERQSARTAKAIAVGGELEALVAQAVDLDRQIQEARAEQAGMAVQDDQAGRYESAAEIGADLPNALIWLAGVSRDFADILRRLIPSFVVVPVQALDTGAVRPRARLTISAAAWATAGVTVPDVTVTVDLFDPPVHIRHAPACLAAGQARPGDSLEAIASGLGIGKMTVKRALDYCRRMEAQGVTDPYRELTSCPPNASRWRQRRPGAPGGDAAA